MKASIRRAVPGDEHDIVRLVHALATYEREPDAVETTPDGLAALLFGEAPKVFAHVAEIDGKVVGISVWFFNFSTWTGRHGIYLEDLFVDPAARGQGIGGALIQDLVDIGRERGWSRLYWHTRASNDVARRLYDKFVKADDFVRYRMILD